MIYIYKITNMVNGKSYIGQTINPKKRWYQHKSSKKSNPLYNSMSKHGIENFTFEIIDICNSQVEADIQEIYLIKEYCATDRKYGYNLTLGGNTNKSGFSDNSKLNRKSYLINSIEFDIYSFSNNSYLRSKAIEICNEIDVSNNMKSIDYKIIIVAMQHYLVNFYELNNSDKEYIVISRDKNNYNIKNYFSTYYKYNIMVPLMDLLEANKYIFLKIGTNKKTLIYLTDKTKDILIEEIKIENYNSKPTNNYKYEV